MANTAMTNKPRVLIVEDNPEERLVLSERLDQWGFNVTAVDNGEEAMTKFSADSFGLVITDLKMPNMDGIELLAKIREKDNKVPVILVSGYATVRSAVKAMQLGAFDFVVKPFSQTAMESLVNKAVAVHGRREHKTFAASNVQIVTRSHRLKALLDLARSVADSRAPVFIQGESGTGKELFARFIHDAGGVPDRPFIPLNCAALPDGLLESELFGHEKGAFTGAIATKQGKFELADGGTILLDEISEMHPNLQAKLLRVLQESEIDRVGGRKPIPVDVRVIATTNRDIERTIKTEKFRSDLYYRLNVIPIKLPALRERPEDIVPLAEHFVRKYNKIDGRKVKGLAKDAVQTLLQMSWPGNVRELENIIERAVLLCKGDRITRADLFLEEGQHENREAFVGFRGSLKEMEKKMIFQALDHTDGNRTHAADILGISVRTLRNKLNEYKRQMTVL